MSNKTVYSCEDCDWRMNIEDMGSITDVQERVLPGELMAAGCCPGCGALMGVADEDVPDYTVEAVMKIAKDRQMIRELVSDKAVVSTHGLRMVASEFLQGLVDSGSVRAEDVGRQMARYGMLDPRDFLAELSERGATFEGQLRPSFDPVQVCEYTASHGHGEPTAEGYALAMSLYAAGDDYDVIGAELATRGLTTEPAGEERYIVFVQSITGTRGTYLAALRGESDEFMQEAALAECAEEWECPGGDLRVVGVVKGEASVLFWNERE